MLTDIKIGLEEKTKQKIVSFAKQDKVSMAEYARNVLSRHIQSRSGSPTTKATSTKKHR